MKRRDNFLDDDGLEIVALAVICIVLVFGFCLGLIVAHLGK